MLAAIFEVGGLYCIWQAIREHKSPWLALLGVLLLVGYGFINTLQNLPTFGRINAVYGGVFILFILLCTAIFDHKLPDLGDRIGAAIILLGIGVIWFGIGRH